MEFAGKVKVTPFPTGDSAGNTVDKVLIQAVAQMCRENPDFKASLMESIETTETVEAQVS